MHLESPFRNFFRGRVVASTVDPPCLHTVCEDAGLRELVANWHRVTPSVKDAIMALLRGG